MAVKRQALVLLSIRQPFLIQTLKPLSISLPLIAPLIRSGFTLMVEVIQVAVPDRQILLM